MSLPSNYITMSCMGNNDESPFVIDTGVKSSSQLEVQTQFYTERGGYMFGARNSNSNTSAGQFGLYLNGGSTSYFCYASSRTAITYGDYAYYRTVGFHAKNNLFEMNCGNGGIDKKTLSATAFTGTRNVYLFGFNNAGTTVNGYPYFSAFRIRDLANNVERNFVPVVDTQTNQYGMYDLANNQFYSASTLTNGYYLVEVQASTGGYAYIKTANAGNVTKQYGYNSYNDQNPIARVNAVAKANAGYVFAYWEDADGNTVSTEREFSYHPTADMVLTAHFRKKTEKEQMLGFKTLAIEYGCYNSANATFRNDIYAEIVNAEIKFDLLQRITTAITVKEVPSLYQTNMPVFVISPRGKVVYCGIISSIDGNVLNCREPLYLFDDEFLFHPNTNVFSRDMTKYSVMSCALSYLGAPGLSTDLSTFSSTDFDYNLYRKVGQLVAVEDTIVPYNRDDALYSFTPLQNETKIENREDYFFSLFNDFGIVVSPSLVVKTTYGNDRHILQLTIEYYKKYETLTIGNNVEVISDINVTREEAENTILHIYNSAGSSIRGYYGMDVDGNIVQYDANSDITSLVGYKRVKLKVVTSDDDLDTLKEQYLTNALYNHKITFNVNFDTSAYNLDDFTLGQRIIFYNGNEIYYSVLTGIEYNINQSDDMVHTAKLTLGKVRTNLTSKLNLGKKK